MTDIKIVRGLSGSGKSTLANKIAGVNHRFSFDDAYASESIVIDRSAGQTASRTIEMYRRIRNVALGRPALIVLDGCFIKLEHVKRLLQSLSGIEHLRFSVHTPNTHWADDPFTCAEKSQHNIPVPVIIRQQQNFEVFNSDKVMSLWTDLWLERVGVV